MIKQYLHLITQSIIKYNQLYRKIDNEQYFEKGAYVSDDIAAMLSPSLWSEMVVPFLNQFYSQQTQGYRTAHIEDLNPDHLVYLDKLRLDHFDPGVSAKLSPAIIRDNCNVPFRWVLTTKDKYMLSPDEISQWVFHAVSDGANSISTEIGAAECQLEIVPKIQAFVQAAKKVKHIS